MSQIFSYKIVQSIVILYVYYNNFMLCVQIYANKRIPCIRVGGQERDNSAVTPFDSQHRPLDFMGSIPHTELLGSKACGHALTPHSHSVCDVCGLVVHILHQCRRCEEADRELLG